MESSKTFLEAPVDLFYPPAYSQDSIYQQQERTKELPQDFVNDLQLLYISKFLFPANPGYALRILSELCVEESVIRYRQDVLRDFMNVPALDEVLHTSIHELFLQDAAIASKYVGAESFIGLNARLGSMEKFIECVHRCDDFYRTYQDSLVSEGIHALLGQLRDLAASEPFRRMEEETHHLYGILAKEVRSVTIGLNFDAWMRPVDAAVLSISNEPFKTDLSLTSFFTHEKTVEGRPVHALIQDNDVSNPVDKMLFQDLKELSTTLLRHLDIAVQQYYTLGTRFLSAVETQLDYYVSCARFFKRLQHQGLPICCPQLLAPGQRQFQVQQLYDPSFAFQLMSADFSRVVGGQVVLNDCNMDDKGRMFIITGPNNGGKTTFTRAIGICQVLAQAGLYVPGQEARLSPVDFIYTHFPKEEQVGLDTSRLTQECKQFKETFSHATPRSLILLNESISSTTPSECISIASEVVRIIKLLRCRAVFTTHLLDLIPMLDDINAEQPNDSPVISVAAGFDEDERPNYIIKSGTPHNFGFARNIFNRYGMSYDAVRERLAAEDSDAE